MNVDADFWAGRRVLVTGHTGFKGAWLSLWLQQLGSEVTGFSAGVPTTPSFHELCDVGARMSELGGDVRDGGSVVEALRSAAPEVVFHLAAQPLVRRGLSEPELTYAINVGGTVNVLDAVRLQRATVRAVVVVTSDKCYANPGSTRRRLREDDELGGADPYSSSKACAELVTSAFRSSYFSEDGATQVATARAGNVIGGGDWAVDRLLPDAVRAVATGVPLRIRNPQSVRPWQHVLSPLAGYLVLAQELFAGRAARAWNFGPAAGDERPVGEIVERLVELWQGSLAWEADAGPHPPEAAHLALDSADAEAHLGWRPACSLEQALALVVDWHRAHTQGHDMRAFSLGQIAELGI